MSQNIPQLSVIIPVYNDRENLQKCLDALERSRFRDFEVIVVDDGSSDDSGELASQRADRFLSMEQNAGQAAARNRGADHACGELLFFLDADVTVEPETLGEIVHVMADNPEYSAMFCSYQPDTPHRNFASQYKNLLHHYTHQESRSEAVTFCGGFGAIRRRVFLDVTGFDCDRRFMEDVDLGYRLHLAGHRILSTPRIQLTHNKRYTLLSLVRSDVMQRAVPWTHVMLERRMYQNDLNTSRHNIISLLVVYLMTLLPLIALLGRGSLWAIGTAGFWILEGFLLTVLVWVNRHFLAFLARRKGLWFAARALGMMFLQHLYSGVGLVIGAVSFAWDRIRGR